MHAYNPINYYMKTFYAAVLAGSISVCALSSAIAQTAQPENTALKIYRETPQKINDL
ncbi:MAG: hypothetical protein JWP67_1981, partial [Mucilaginibacter sp.]|nr:hypothetical protein [Mucilaginibacter sp.]